jgi:hypothetical protein
MFISDYTEIRRRELKRTFCGAAPSDRKGQYRSNNENGGASPPLRQGIVPVDKPCRSGDLA